MRKVNGREGLPRLLCVFDEVAPFLSETKIGISADLFLSRLARYNQNIRTFTPKWGLIKEKRYQLHEVIRLSGINIIFDERDHLLTVKAASLPRVRTQIYFIDNNEYFERVGTMVDETGKVYPDTHERIFFFTRSVIKCVERLLWAPHFVHVGGPFSSFIPLFVKSFSSTLPHFANSSITVSLIDGKFEGEINSSLLNLLKEENIREDLSEFLPFTWENVTRMALKYADRVVFHTEEMKNHFIDYVEQLGLPYFSLPDIEDPNYELELTYLLDELEYMPLPEEYAIARIHRINR